MIDMIICINCFDDTEPDDLEMVGGVLPIHRTCEKNFQALNPTLFPPTQLPQIKEPSKNAEAVQHLSGR